MVWWSTSFYIRTHENFALFGLHMSRRCYSHVYSTTASVTGAFIASRAECFLPIVLNAMPKPPYAPPSPYSDTISPYPDRLWGWHTERGISDLVVTPASELITTAPNSPQASPKSGDTTPSLGLETDKLASKINGKVSARG